MDIEESPAGLNRQGIFVVHLLQYYILKKEELSHS